MLSRVVGPHQARVSQIVQDVFANQRTIDSALTEAGMQMRASLAKGDVPTVRQYEGVLVQLLRRQMDPNHDLLREAALQAVKELPPKEKIEPIDKFFTFGGTADGVSGQYVLGALNDSHAEQILLATAFENLTLAVARAYLYSTPPLIDSPEKDHPSINSNLPVVHLEGPIEYHLGSGV